MTVDELIAAFRNGEYGIICDTPEQRAEAVRILVEYGVPHGTSGYSQKFLKDPYQESGHWLTVAMSGGIEFWDNHPGISFEEFASAFRPPVSVDDLI